MMTVTGRLDGRPVTARWAAGEWQEGDPDLLAALLEVPASERLPVTPTGPFWEADQGTARGAWVAALEVLDGNPLPVLDGPGVPEVPDDAPEGAVY